jgi:sugar-specific transcriptional regulator TrmB
MQITELAAKVQTLGLSEKEARVYVAALFLGPSPVQKIAQQADVNRATAYVILEQLGELGLVAQSTEGKKTVFVAEGPETLKRLFERQIAEVETRRHELEDILPELQGIQRAETNRAPIVRFYKGQDGVANMANELHRKARPGSEGYGFVNYDEVDKINSDALKSNSQRRAKKQNSSKIIYSYHKEVPSDPKLRRQTVKVKDPIKADISLREGIAVFSTYAGKDTLGVVIESDEIAGALRQLYELAWNNLQK